MKEEIEQLMRELFYEEWMSEEDYQEFWSHAQKMLGITTDTLVNDVNIGISNGFDKDTQFLLLRNMIPQLKSYFK